MATSINPYGCVCVSLVLCCRAKQEVHVVVDPLLSDVLRPHQREVSTGGVIGSCTTGWCVI